MAMGMRRRYGAQGLHGLSPMPAEIPTGLQVPIPNKSEKQGRGSVAVGSDTGVWEGKGGNIRKTVICLRRPTAPLNLRLAMRHVCTTTSAARLQLFLSRNA